MKHLAVLLAFAFGLAAAFVVGARVGAREQTYGISQYRAIIDYGYLKVLSSDPSALKNILEDDLDDELIMHGQYLQSNWSWLLPQLKPEGNKYALKASQYRLQNPHELQVPYFPPGTDPEFVGQLQANVKERETALQRVLAVYRNAAQPAVQADVHEKP